MGSRAFCDTRTGGDAHWVCTGLHPRDERTKPGEAPQDAPHDVLGRRDAVGGTPSLCQEPSETDAGTSTLVGNAPLSVQNRTNLPDTLISARVHRRAQSARFLLSPFSSRRLPVCLCSWFLLAAIDASAGVLLHRAGVRSQGVAGRPESVTMTCSLPRSRTAVTVVVQDWPFRGCTTMFAPTSSGGRAEASPR